MQNLHPCDRLRVIWNFLIKLHNEKLDVICLHIDRFARDSKHLFWSNLTVSTNNVHGVGYFRECFEIVFKDSVAHNLVFTLENVRTFQNSEIWTPERNLCKLAVRQKIFVIDLINDFIVGSLG
jgi:hypothetical protein